MQISDKEYREFCSFIYAHCGISLHEGKKEMVKARVGKQIRLKNLSSFKEYFNLVQNDKSEEELINLLNVISTNLTFFFRESKHFDYLKANIIPEINKNGFRKLRFWSAGCSTGEEPYTLAMVIMDYLNTGINDWKILATDLSTKVLNMAKNGIYAQEKLREVPPEMRRKYFQKGMNIQSGFYKVKDNIKEHIHFARLNLMEPFPMKGPFDVIFCRNVMIYFDRSTQEELSRKFYAILRPGGFFFVGHSESLLGIKHEFKYLGPSIYQKR